jgi:cytochrome c oxidase cbb3-type subunit 3/ubiquinol-cytochrome c reductase cytochrome c subunit
MLFSCMTLLGCGQLPGHPKPGPEVPRPEAVLDFPTLYRQNCSGCHGAQGMNGASYPLANPAYQSLVDEQILRQTIANGEVGTHMPPFAISAGGTLTDQQVDVLVNGMRAAWFKAGTLEGANPPPYKAGKPADSAHGQQIYTTYCASCHGAPGASGKSKAGSITEPAFLALVSDQVLRTVVIAGRPDIGQPDWRNDLPGHAMSDQEVTDVVGWLSSQRPSAQQNKAAGGAQ